MTDAMIIGWIVIAIGIGAFFILKKYQKRKEEYLALKERVFNELGFTDFMGVDYYDKVVIVKSRRTLGVYSYIDFFKNQEQSLIDVEIAIKKKRSITNKINVFLLSNQYENCSQYYKVEYDLHEILHSAENYRVRVRCISSAGNLLDEKELIIDMVNISWLKENPSLLMSKMEYNKYLKNKEMESLKLKQHKFYELVNNIIDCANENKDKFIIDGDKEQLDEIISQLLDKIANNIIKVKSSDSEEWNFIDNYIQHTKKEMDDLIESNQMVLDYYDSSDFLRIKQTCNMVMSSQKEFNDYIKKKSQSIEQLFGKRIIRNETDHEDVYHYVRQYKKN